VRAILPAWVFEAPAAAAPTGPGDAPDADAPDEDVAPEFQADLLDAAKRVAEDDFAGAIEAIDALRKRGAPERWLGLLEARAYLGLDEPNKALAAIDRVIAADRESVEALLTKAMVLYELGRDDEFAVTLRAATASPRAPLAVYEAATLYALLAGRPDDARAAVDAAARRQLTSPRLDALSKFVVRALNGPDWPKSFEFKSANYHVVSDIDVEICKVAAGVLEEALTQYRVRVRPLKAGPRRLYRVYLFSGKAGFERYRGDSSLFGGKGMENAAGIYSPMLKQLLIWNLSSRDEMLVTIRHEGFHQYLDRLLPDPPVWFDEGLAVYYEGMKRVAGELKTDLARAEYLDALEGKDLVPLRDFVRIRPKDFYATSPGSYAQAWLFLHMLQHGTQKHRDLFKAFLTRLETSSGAEAVAALLDDATLAGLDKDLEAHRVTMKSKR
jgi:tetratricopeptide (TPR) repeat protein